MAVLPLLLLLLPAAALRHPLDKPNFVMLFVDDLGYGDMGFTGHPTTQTPIIDSLVRGGRQMTGWYSGCSVCSGSRAALMTGRQYVRTGVPGVFDSDVGNGLPLNETTLGQQLRSAGYRTAIVGKWHLGQRPMYLPGRRGFERYLGIPYSDDMGDAQNMTPCDGVTHSPVDADTVSNSRLNWQAYVDAGYMSPDTTATYTPLVLLHQENGTLQYVQQPLQFRTLGQKYRDFAVETIDMFKNDPFFLYLPFSHVHATSSSQPGNQYSSCREAGHTARGRYGDALLESDWITGEVMQKVRDTGLEKNTLVVFSSDNGPWMHLGKAAGSVGLFYARTAGYWNVGKGSTWEGGIRVPAFAYWPGQIAALSKTSNVVSTLDMFPTFSKLAGVPLPSDRVYDGVDASEVLLHGGQTSRDFLWFYAFRQTKPVAVRYKAYKAHFMTGPGLHHCDNCTFKHYPANKPLLFHVNIDPSEAYPLTGPQDVIDAIYAGFIEETTGATRMVFGTLDDPPPAEPGEVPGEWAVCCDHARNCTCTPGPAV